MDSGYVIIYLQQHKGCVMNTQDRPAEYLTVVFKVVPGEAVTAIHSSGDWVVSSWSHAVNDRDRLEAITKSQESEIDRLRMISDLVLSAARNRSYKDWSLMNLDISEAAELAEELVARD